MLDIESLSLLTEALQHLDGGFQSLPPFQSPQPDRARVREVLLEVAGRMRDNFPYFHPQYAGQMMQPPHVMARLAYSLALYVNPNNHAIDGGRASSKLEREAVAGIAAMFGWREHLGHLTGGGTMANLEALWIAGQLAPGKTIVASEQAHYTHERICGVLQLPFRKVKADRHARMDARALQSELARGDVGTVVVTLGTSGLGALDPLDEVLELQKQHGFRVHVDAAYGGYYRLADNLSERGLRIFGLIDRADSIVVDPHKHGLQPYGCGCVVFREPSVGRFYDHDSPYTYFSSEELHLGEISLECSRAGAAAVALWATQRLLPLQKGGEFARRLAGIREGAVKLFGMLKNDDRWWTPWEPEVDILVWLPRGARASEISQRTRAIYRSAAERQLHLAVTQVAPSLLGDLPIEWDQPYVACLRSCLMKAEHADWAERIFALLGEAASAAS